MTPGTPPGPARLQPAVAARPTSPVGRTTEALRTDPAARTPLPGIGPHLQGLTDVELHALTDALLAEKHRRIARWLPPDPRDGTP